MKFTESVDGKMRLSVRVVCRIDINDMIEMCIRCDDTKITKKQLLKKLRHDLIESGEGLIHENVLFNMAMHGDPTQCIETADEKTIEMYRKVVVKHFPELRIDE